MMIRNGRRGRTAMAAALSILTGSAPCRAQDVTLTGTYPGSNGRNLYYDGGNGLLYTVGEDAALYSTQLQQNSNTTTEVTSRPSTLLADPAFPVNACEMVLALFATLSVITATGTAKGVACHAVGLGYAVNDAVVLANVDLFTGYNGYWNADRDIGGWCYNAEQPNNQGPGFTQGCPYEGRIDPSVTPVAVDLGHIWGPVASDVTNTGDLVHYAADVLGYEAIAFASGPLAPTAAQQAAIVGEMAAAGIDLSGYRMVAFKPKFASLADSDWHVAGDGTVLCDPAHFSDDMVSKAPYLLGAIYCGTLATVAVAAPATPAPPASPVAPAAPAAPATPVTLPTPVTPTYLQAVPNQAGSFRETGRSNGSGNGGLPAGTGGVDDMTGDADLTGMAR